MKQFFKLTLSVLIVTTVALFLASCTKDDDKPKTIPEVITFDESDVTTTTVTVGGEITSDGNDEILSSGVVYSNENDVPTLEALDAFAESDVLEPGTFNLELTDLESGTTYRYRAYAINSKGVGYGEVKDFTLGNAAPTVSNVTITGTIEVDQEVAVDYDYDDSEGDLEDGTTFQWYVADDGAGTNETAIAGATSETYVIALEYEFKHIRVGVTPKSDTGTQDGAEVKSSISSPVAESTTFVRFEYNGQQVTYGIINSPTTGRKWLDRNLGAPNQPTAYNDFANYGDLFQWGRKADGHQLINRASNSSGTTAVNGTTNITSSSENPGNLFILPTSDPFDWLIPQNNNLWQLPAGLNDPCPSGWHVPTKPEWNAEISAGNLNSVQKAFAQLKLTLGGYRRVPEGTFSNVSAFGQYWSSTLVDNTTGGMDPVTFYFWTFELNPELSSVRATGLSIRCIETQ